ncbi:MAG: NfeD family protein [PVC group bacterium]
MIWIIFLFVVGLLMVCLEVFIPGGIVGTLGAVAMIGSVILGFTDRGTAFGFYWMGGVLILTLFGLYLSIRFLPRSPAGRRLFLHSSEAGYAVAGEEGEGLIGKTGLAFTDLRPAGLIDVEERRIDVVTGGEYIVKGRTVTVIGVEGNRVIVAERDTKDEGRGTMDEKS